MAELSQCAGVAGLLEQHVGDRPQPVVGGLGQAARRGSEPGWRGGWDQLIHGDRLQPGALILG
jgi:hypothetical protein